MKQLASFILTCSIVILLSKCAVVQKRDDLKLAQRTLDIQDKMIDITNRLACRYQSLGALFARLERRFLVILSNQSEDKERVMQHKCHEAMTKGMLCTMICEDFKYGTLLPGGDATVVKRDVSQKLKRLYMLARTAKNEINEIQNDIDDEQQELEFLRSEDAILAMEQVLVIFEDICAHANDEKRVFSDNLFILHTVNFDALFRSLKLLEQCLYKLEQKIENEESNASLLSTEYAQDLCTFCWKESFDNLKQWVSSLVLDAKVKKKIETNVSKIFRSLRKQVKHANKAKTKLIRLFDDKYDKYFDDADPRSYKSKSALNKLNRLANDLFKELQKNSDKISNELLRIEAKIYKKYRFRNPLCYFLILEHKKITEEIVSFMLAIQMCQTRQEMHINAFSKRPLQTWRQHLVFCF